MAAVSQDPADIEQMFQRAFALHGQGNHADARAIYERIFSLVPGHPGTLQMLASLAFYHGDDTQGEAYRDRAIRNYRAAIAQIPPQQRTAIMNLRAGLVNLLLSADETAAAEAEAGRVQIPLNPLFVEAREWSRLREQAIRKERPRILLNTIPKSASETIWNQLASGLGMAQCHISLGLFPNCMALPNRVRDFARGGIIAKEHLAPTAFNVGRLTAAGIDRIVLHLRDPRQVTLSWAHFVRDEIAQTPLGPLWRQTCPPASHLHADFETLLDWCIDHYLPRVVKFMEDWLYIHEDPETLITVKFVTFEEFLDCPQSYLRSIFDLYGLSENVEPDDTLAQDGHFRRGERDEWRHVFTEDQHRRANAHLPSRLIDAFGWPP